jgi:excisionase family DNA binding protein
MSVNVSLPAFLTVEEAAAILRCKPEKIYRLAARGEIPSYKIEGRRLLDESEFADWLEAHHDGRAYETNGRRSQGGS